MKIIQFALAPGDGTVTDHHKITGIDLRGATAVVSIDSYPDDGEGDALLTLRMARSVYEMPVSALSADPDPYEAAAMWLTAPGRPFEAGAVSAVPLPVPQVVSPLQMRRALRQAGLIDAVNAFVAAQAVEVQEAWEYAIEILRSHEVIAAGTSAMGMTEEEVDDLFRLAATL